MSIEVIVRVKDQDADATQQQQDGTQEVSTLQGTLALGVVQRRFVVVPEDANGN